MKKKLFWIKFHTSWQHFLQNVINIWKFPSVFCNAHHAFLGPQIMSALINEAMSWQGLVTFLLSPTAVWVQVAGVAPQLPGTCQRWVQARKCSYKAVFSSPPCSAERRKFSYLEISVAVPSWPQVEECALIGFLDMIRCFLTCRLLSMLSFISWSWLW